MKKLNYTLFLLGGLALLSGCSSEEELENSISKHSSHIATTEVLGLRPAKEVVIPGELKPWDKVDIFPKTKGFIKSVKADRGAIVQEGQVLAVLESPETVAELNQSKAQLQAFQGTLQEQKAKFHASKSTYLRLLKTSQTNGAVSASELEHAHARYIADSAIVLSGIEHVNSAREFYNAKKQIVDYLTITAPFDGVIMERNISPGTLVGPELNGQKPMYVLVNSSKLRLTVAVPEVYSGSISKKAVASFTVNSLPDQHFKANYARSAENIDNHVRVMLTEFDVPNQNYQLKAGMYAEVKIPVQRKGHTLFVPTKSIVTSSEKVFVIKVKDHQAEWVNVRRGNVVDTLTEVFGNIKEGDRLVLKASEEIRDGQKVK